MTRNFNPANDSFLRNISAPQVLVYKDVRENIHREVEALDHYQHSSTVDATVDVESMATKLLKAKVFNKVPGRRSYSNDSGGSESPSVDLFGLGYTRVVLGQPIAEYQKRLRKEQQAEESDGEEVRDPQDWSDEEL